MAESDEVTHESLESQKPLPATAESSAVLPVSSYPPSTPPFQSVSAQAPGMLERWRTPLIVALVVVLLVFGVLDVSTIFLHLAQNSGTTRPLIVNAQIVGDPAPAAHPDLGLAPGSLSVACDKSGRVTVTNLSARPLQWTVTTDGDAVTFSADTPRSGLLAPGHSITLIVLTFSRPGSYLLHFSDDHGESADLTVQVVC